MAAQAPRRCREPAGSRRPALHLYPAAAKSVAQRSHHQRDRAAARRVQATRQDADPAAIGGHRGHAVLGLACLRPDQHAQGRWLAKRSPPNPSISQLTSLLDQITSNRWRSRSANSNNIPDGTAGAIQPVKVRPKLKGSVLLGSECCVATGDGGCEAYTAIAWGVGLSHERSDIAGAEGFHSLEGNMCGTAMRGADALPGSKATSRAKGSYRNLGDLVSGRRRRVRCAEYGGPHREGEEP